MEKRTVVITGGNSGLGYQCAKNIAESSKEYTIVLACRNLAKAQKAVLDLKKDNENAEIIAMQMDLASLKSVRNFVKNYKEANLPPLFSIVCNAGLNRPKLAYTTDGFEEIFGVCHLGHFLLVNSLLDCMVDDGRVVFVASDMHKPPMVMSPKAPEFKDAYRLAYPKKGKKASVYELSLRYSLTKLCNILCTYEMARLLKEKGSNITVNAFNPGLMTDTNFMPPNTSKFVQSIMIGASTMVAKMTNRYGTALSSGRELAKMVTDSMYSNVSGKYIDRGTDKKSSEPSYDKVAAQKLWKQSEELVGLGNEN